VPLLPVLLPLPLELVLLRELPEVLLGLPEVLLRELPEVLRELPEVLLRELPSELQELLPESPLSACVEGS
jgi:hypothetical protein